MMKLKGTGKKKEGFLMARKTLKKIEGEIKKLYPNISIWMEAMNVSSTTKMVKHGFIRAYVFKNFNIKNFCKGFEIYLKKRFQQILTKPNELYKDFIINHYNNKAKRLKGKSIKKENLPEVLCHYLSRFAFYDKIISGGDEGLGPGERLKLKKHPLFIKMAKGELIPEDCVYWDGELGGAGEIVWFTCHDALPDEVRECLDSPDAASRIRDLLGMAHLYGDGFIEVQIPREVVEKGAKVPTICEAAGYPYFRPAKRKDGFGRTIDLATKDTGLPEGVHIKIKWSKNLGTRYLGELPEVENKFDESCWQQVTKKSEGELIELQEGIKDEA
jgi:hypothetical protein